MTTFQIISLIVNILLFLGSVIGVYVKLKLDITKVELKIEQINRELTQKEIATLLDQKNNREDHAKIIEKIDHLIDKLSSK